MAEPTRREREQLEREETIISKAGELFSTGGFEKVSMDDIAAGSEFTKRTIYRYFSCKEDLLFAVASRGYSRLFDMMKSESAAGRTGLDKIRLSYNAFYKFYRQYPQMLQLINMSGMIKPASAGMELPHRLRYMEFDRQVFEELITVFKEGRYDGSIRSDIDASLLAFSSIFTATGFFQLFSSSGETFSKHFGLDRDLFIKTTIDILVDSLRSR